MLDLNFELQPQKKVALVQISEEWQYSSQTQLSHKLCKEAPSQIISASE